MRSFCCKIEGAMKKFIDYLRFNKKLLLQIFIRVLLFVTLGIGLVILIMYLILAQ